VEEELKKLETDRAAAAVKGDVATLEKQTSDDYTFINLYGQMSDKSQMVNNFKTGRTKLTSNEVSDMKVRGYGNTAVITVRPMSQERWREKIPRAKSCSRGST